MTNISCARFLWVLCKITMSIFVYIKTRIMMVIVYIYIYVDVIQNMYVCLCVLLVYVFDVKLYKWIFIIKILQFFFNLS